MKLNIPNKIKVLFLYSISHDNNVLSAKNTENKKDSISKFSACVTVCLLTTVVIDVVVLMNNDDKNNKKKKKDEDITNNSNNHEHNNNKIQKERRYKIPLGRINELIKELEKNNLNFLEENTNNEMLAYNKKKISEIEKNIFNIVDEIKKREEHGKPIYDINLRKSENKIILYFQLMFLKNINNLWEKDIDFLSELLKKIPNLRYNDGAKDQNLDKEKNYYTKKINILKELKKEIDNIIENLYNDIKYNEIESSKYKSEFYYLVQKINDKKTKIILEGILHYFNSCYFTLDSTIKKFIFEIQNYYSLDNNNNNNKLTDFCADGLLHSIISKNKEVQLLDMLNIMNFELNEEDFMEKLYYYLIQLTPFKFNYNEVNCSLENFKEVFYEYLIEIIKVKGALLQDFRDLSNVLLMTYKFRVESITKKRKI